MLGRQTGLWPKAFLKPIMRFVPHGPCHLSLPYQVDDSDIVLKDRSLGLGQAAASHF